MFFISVALKYYRGGQADVQKELAEMEDDSRTGVNVSVDVVEKRFTVKKLFTTGALRKPLLIACLLQVIQQFSGVNAVRLTTSSSSSTSSLLL